MGLLVSGLGGGIDWRRQTGENSSGDPMLVPTQGISCGRVFLCLSVFQTNFHTKNPIAVYLLDLILIMIIEFSQCILNECRAPQRTLWKPSQLRDVKSFRFQDLGS